MQGITAIISRNLLNFTRDKMRVVFSFIMSFFFLFIFSFVMHGNIQGINQPINYLIAGIVIMTVFQQALNFSMEILTDISSGYMKEILVSPLARWKIAIGQILSSALIAAVQGTAILTVCLFIGFRTDLLHFLLSIMLMLGAGFVFGAFGLFLATIARNSSTFQILISVIAMPLTLVSGAYIPTTLFPGIFKNLVILNPLTHLTSLFRLVSMNMENLSLSQQINSGIAFKAGDLTVTPVVSAILLVVMGLIFFLLCLQQFLKADFSNIKVFKQRH